MAAAGGDSWCRRGLLLRGTAVAACLLAAVVSSLFTAHRVCSFLCLSVWHLDEGLTVMLSLVHVWQYLLKAYLLFGFPELKEAFATVSVVQQQLLTSCITL